MSSEPHSYEQSTCEDCADKTPITWSPHQLQHFILDGLKHLTDIGQLPCKCCLDKAEEKIKTLEEQLKETQAKLKEQEDSFEFWVGAMRAYIRRKEGLPED
jgi:hypothetical protein